MVFKPKFFFFFSLKKSRSSDSSNSPQSVGSNSPVESDKKKSKSNSKEETRSPNRSLSFRLCLKTKTKTKKDDSSKGKDASSSQVHFPNPGKSKLASSGDETPLPTSEVKDEPPILDSCLGLNRSNTRSSSLPQEEGSSSHALPVSETGQYKVSPPSYSGPVGSSEYCTPENLYELENPRKRFHGDIKSFSHELNSKAVRSFPLWKPRGLHNLEEILNLIRNKFDKEKEEVNSDLATFAWDLVVFLNSHHELQLQIEDLLLLARKCVQATPREFWRQCEDIVQKLDDRRQELSSGVLKQLYARMLFILTRCTRLLQFHNENWEQEVVQLRQSRVLHSADKRVPTGEVRDWRVWKRFPSPASKGVKESAVSKEQNDSKVEPPKVIIPFEEISILCRICEEEVCTTYVEDHSRICALADKYDKKGVSVDERLVALAVTLVKIIEFVQKESLAAVESPDGMKISNASLTEESDVLSPKAKRRDWSRRVSEDMLDCFLEADNSAFMDDIQCRTSVSCRTRFDLKSDQGMTTSSAGSMTPRSPIPTPKPDLIELLLGGKVAFHDQDDIPQMSELVAIAICAVSVNPDGDHSTELLLSCLQDLKVVIKSRKFDALIVETFGKRIEIFIMKKYLQLWKILGDEKVDLSSTVIDEDAPLEDDVVRSLRKTLVDPRDRTSIEDFDIIKEISRGAFGAVFLAKKRITGDIFAIKVLKKADMIRKNAVKSILAERDILINARNPFVVRFFYSFTCPEKLYLVMEYLNGGDFYSLLRKLGSLDESIARVYIAEIVLALEYLHSEGVVHRDLKPDNLLISHDGHVKLTDFGLSKVGLINSTDDLSGPVLSGTSLLVEEKPKLPTSEQKLERQEKRSVVGTPDYLAPEILLGAEHGAAVDWWSVGIILFELIVGIPPFNADHPQEIFENILNRNIPWPRVPENMSGEARDLIDRLLTEDPKQRLGARGAAEVKQHIFFEGINWDTLAEQKAAFVPDSKNALDTSYFQSRYSSNISDEQCVPTNEKEYSSDRGSSGCFSNHHNEGVDERDELAEFEMSEDHPFNNYSLKNLVELGYLTRDVMYKYETQLRSHRR